MTSNLHEARPPPLVDALPVTALQGVGPRLAERLHRLGIHSIEDVLLHLPLQAGSDAILKAMNRHYDTAEFARLIETVEDAVPGVAISTDIIVGFPGETEELFQQSLDFAARMNFARMHVFPYSRRKGTPAASMPDQVAPEVKKDRVHRMQQLADQKAAEFHAAFLGRTVDVLFETAHEGVWDGLTGNYIRVYTDAPVTGGSISRVRLERLYRDGIWGRLA